MSTESFSGTFPGHGSASGQTPPTGPGSASGQRASAGRRASGGGRLVAVLGLLLLSPYCAELLSAYQGPVTGLIGSVLFPLALLAPLYGTAAVLIREVARRTGMGWPGILSLSAAFGLIQAGLIDQSLLNHDEMAKSVFWEAPVTLVPLLDVDAAQLLTFVVGHTIWSFAAPIAVVEACVPRIADRPWLGRFGLTVTTLLYLAAAAFFLNDLVLAKGTLAPPAKLAGVAIVVLALMVIAFRLRSRPGRAALREAVSANPAPLSVALGTFVLLTVEELTPQSWAGVAIRVGCLVLLGVLLLRWSGRESWTGVYVLAVAGSALVARAAIAFLVPPLGASVAVKLISSTVVLLALLGLLGWAWFRTSRARSSRPTTNGPTTNGPTTNEPTTNGAGTNPPA